MNSDHLIQLLDKLAHPRILVVGDVILDRYVAGDVERISPEAPIPVLKVQRAELRLGGAGNVAANLRSMEAEVSLVGLVGDDTWGSDLRVLLEETGTDASGVVIDAARPTVRKTRFMSGVQQILRVDWEEEAGVSAEIAEKLRAQVEQLMQTADAVVLSDYGKGVLSDELCAHVLRLANERGVPVVADPKGSNYMKYKGATLVSPNRKEAELALGRSLRGDDAIAAGARELATVNGIEAAVITLGAGGIHYCATDGAEGRVSAKARAVYDVTGAGDTVVAHLALHLGAGASLSEAVELANAAAGVVVGRVGAATTTKRELSGRLRAGEPLRGKVLAADQLDALLERWRAEGKHVVFTNGCFDVLHRGHVEYLRFAKQQGDVLLVGINDDESVRRLKGETRPLNGLEDRLEVLAALEPVDAVIAFSEDTPLALVERVTPQVLVKGEDWKEKGVVGREWVERHGGKVVLAPMVPGRSTTAILGKSQEADGLDPAAPR